MSQLFFGIPREYAFLFFHNNRDTAQRESRIYLQSRHLRTVSYLVDSYVLSQWTLGLILYLLVVGAEMAVVYFCLIHLKELRSTEGP